MPIEVSIIIPHKNTLKDLSKLLDTAYNTGQSVEIIVVDDQSRPDQNPLLLKERYPHVAFIQNPGPDFNAGAARNIGIDHAVGNWLVFADADDQFTERALKSILQEISRAQPWTELIFFDVTSYDPKTGTEGRRHRDRSKKVELYFRTGEETGLRYQSPQPWGKAIRRTLVDAHQIRFDSLAAGNDTGFSLLVGHYSKSVSASQEVVYCVFENSASLTVSPSPERWLARLEGLVSANKKLLEWSKDELSSGWGFRYFCGSIRQRPSIRQWRIYADYFIVTVHRLMRGMFAWLSFDKFKSY